MILTRDIAKTAHPDGTLIYRRLQRIPVRVKFREFSVALRDDAARRRLHHLTIAYDGTVVVELDFTGGETLRHVFDPPLALARGNAEFRMACTGFDAGEQIAAAVTLDFSLAIFG